MTADSDYPDPIELTREFVAIPSPFHQEHAMVDRVERALKDGGFMVRRQEVADGRCNLLAEKGVPGRPAILFIGHMDTVPIPPGYDSEHIDPFELRYDEANGVYRGLGAADMKGGLAAVVAGLSNFNPVNSRVKVAFCVDEENLSLGVHTLLKDERQWLDDVRLIISADTGAVPFVVRHNFPPVLCIMGRLGRFTINATIHGASGHGAHADPSMSAPMEMGRLLVLLDAAREQLFSRHEFLGRADISIAGVKSTADGFTTPDVAKVQLNWMALPDDTPEAAVARLRSLVTNALANGALRNTARPVEFEVPRRITPYGNGYATPRYGPMLDLVNTAYSDILGEPPRYVIGRSVADENVYAEALPELPVINLGPKGGDLHTGNEWIDVHSIPTAAALYREVATVFDALGMYKPFHDALSEHERTFVRVAVLENGSWDALRVALAHTGIDTRRIGEKVSTVMAQFFPPRGGQAKPIELTDRAKIRMDLSSAFRVAIDYLDGRPVDALPIESGELAIPTGGPGGGVGGVNGPAPSPTAVNWAPAPVVPPAPALAGWDPGVAVPEAAPIDVLPERNPVEERAPIESWDTSQTGGRMSSSRHRAVSLAPKPPAEGSDSDARIITPSTASASDTGMPGSFEDANDSGGGTGRFDTRGYPRRAPKLPPKDGE